MFYLNWRQSPTVKNIWIGRYWFKSAPAQIWGKRASAVHFGHHLKSPVSEFHLLIFTFIKIKIYVYSLNWAFFWRRTDVRRYYLILRCHCYWCWCCCCYCRSPCCLLYQWVLSLHLVGRQLLMEMRSTFYAAAMPTRQVRTSTSNDKRKTGWGRIFSPWNTNNDYSSGYDISGYEMRVYYQTWVEIICLHASKQAWLHEVSGGGWGIRRNCSCNETRT